MAKGVVRVLSVFCILSLLAGLAGCSAAGPSVDENLFRGGAAVEEDKLVITVTCQAGIGHFAAAVEERFPNVRLVQDIYQGEYVESEHVTRMEHEDIGDILMMKAGLIPLQDLSGLLIDLSARSMPANYNSSALQTDSDGRIYLISGPLSFNCNV